MIHYYREFSPFPTTCGGRPKHAIRILISLWQSGHQLFTTLSMCMNGTVITFHSVPMGPLTTQMAEGNGCNLIQWYLSYKTSRGSDKIGLIRQVVSHHRCTIVHVSRNENCTYKHAIQCEQHNYSAYKCNYMSSTPSIINIRYNMNNTMQYKCSYNVINTMQL